MIVIEISRGLVSTDMLLTKVKYHENILQV